MEGKPGAGSRSRAMLAVALCALVAFAATGCKKGTSAITRPSGPGDVALGSSPGAPSSIGSPSGGSNGTGGSPSPKGGSGSGSGSGSATGAFTADDLQTYGYALTDEAALAADLSAMSATLAALEGDLAARDVNAAESDARDLLDQADRMGADAGDATDRMHPLQPSDGDLQRIRSDALSAFGLTAEYADTAVDLANAALALDLKELATVAQQATALAGTSQELTASYTDLSNELAAFAQAEPQAAAKALAQYGG